MDYVGIDVSAKTLVVCHRHDGHELKIGEYSNDPAGFKKLFSRLTKKGSQTRVCLEPTGIYHLELCLALHKKARIEVMVVNPRAMRSFAEAAMSRHKTDIADAQVIALYAERMDFIPWIPPPDHALRLRQLSRRLVQLANLGVQEKNRLHSAKAAPSIGQDLIPLLQESISWLHQQTTIVEQQALLLIQQCPEMQKQLCLLCSIPGIAKRSAILLLGEWCVMHHPLDVRQLTAMAGLDPIEKSSGTSVRGRSRISKKGNVYLRRALYMPALVAVQRDPFFQHYYEHLQLKGKNKRQALVATMRKMLHAMHGILKNRTAYDGSLLFGAQKLRLCA